MTYAPKTSPAMQPARQAEAFEQNINTFESQGHPPETSQPTAPEAVQAPSSSSAAQKDAVDAMDDRVNEIIKPQVSPGSGNPKDSQTELLINLAISFATIFNTPEGDTFASILVKDHYETVKVPSRLFKQLLRRDFYRKTGKSPGPQTIKDAMEILEAEGKYDGPEIPVHIRYAWHEGSIYIDLGDKSWNQVLITNKGWTVIGSKDSPVKFFRPQGMAPMPIPTADGSIELLRRYLNIESDSDWVMIVSWIIDSLRPSGPFAILVLQGEQGTAKSTTAKFLRDLIDPSFVPSQSLPRSERDLVIAASKSWVLNFDNLSYLSPSMSDALCRLSTGGGFRTRALYTDDNERLFNATRPMIMNGIADLATRHDLADRSLIVQLPTISKDKRVPEKELMMYWNLTKGKIFGALCNALSVALANVESIKLSTLPRMADFATWATAVEPAFGWEPGTFMREYENNQKALVLNALEADPVAIAIIRLVKRHQQHQWHGTASDLLRILGVNQDLASLRNWPRTANVLSGRVRRAAASLREIGIEVEFTKSGDRLIHIVPSPEFKLDDGFVCESNHAVDDGHIGPEEANMMAEANQFDRMMLDDNGDILDTSAGHYPDHSYLDEPLQ